MTIPRSEYRGRIASSLAGIVLLAVCALSVRAMPIDARITGVAVYPDRAVVTRTGVVEIGQAGVIELEYGSLPIGVIDESLQVSGEGSAQASILDVSLKTEFLSAPSDPRIKELETELAGLQAQLAALEDKADLIKQQEGFVDQIRTGVTQAPGKEQTRPTIEDWQRLLAFNEEVLTKLAKERRELDGERQALQARVDALNREIQSLKQGEGRERKVASVRLKAGQPGKLSLRLSYAIVGARWTPVYDARLSTEKRTLELAYYGFVSNRTGEDWNQVSMTLSTARPSLGGAAPEPSDWIVDVAAPVPLPAPAVFNATKAQSARMKRAVSGLGGDETIELSAFSVADASAAVQTNATSATFEIEAPVTLKTDGTTQKVPIAVVSRPAELEYKAVPKLAPTAYLEARVTNESDYPLLGGQANAFLDGAFLASTSIKTVMPGEKLELSLGADEGIAVKHKQVTHFTESTGLTSKGKRVTYEYLVTISNNKKTEERLSFSEPVPQSRNEKIQVRLLSPSERELGAKDGLREVSLEDGRLNWKLVLKPGEKREIPVKFSIEYPADLPVVGVE